MAKWEYRIEDPRRYDRPTDEHLYWDGTETRRSFNELGADGWEAVGFVPGEELVLFKRQID